MKRFVLKNTRVVFFVTLFASTLKGQVDTSILNDIKAAKEIIESNTPLALEAANSAFISSRDADYDPGIAECYLIVGQCYIQTADYDQAIKSLDIALKYAEKIKDKALISDCYFYMGKACFITANTEKQLLFYNKAYAIRKELNDEKRMADSYHGFGNVYLALKKDSLAENYFILSKEIRTKLNDLRGLAASCNNLAIIAGDRGDTRLYRNLMLQSVKMNEQSGNKRYLATNYGNLGLSYMDQRNYDSAWYYTYLAYKIRKDNNIKDHLAGTYTDLGDILFAQKKYLEALTFYKEGADVAQSISGTEWMIKNYKALAKTYDVLDSSELKNKYSTLADKLTKDHKADTLLTKKIPPPPAFDFKGPENKTSWIWWTSGGGILAGLTGIALFRRKKR